MLKPSPKPSGKPRRNTFEGVDLAAAGRKGGRASQLSRQLRPLRQLEAGIIQSRNGAAKAKLLEQKRRDQAELLERQLQADRMVAELDSLAYDLRATVADLSAECDTARAELAALEQRKQATASLDDDAVVALLRDVGEQRLERVLGTLGWLDDDVEREDVDAA